MVSPSVLLLLAAASPLLAAVPPSPCDPIQQAFQAVVRADGKKEKNATLQPACRCFLDSGGPNPDIWIGCSGYSLPMVFDSLRSLNETLVSRLHIWDSLINIMPEDIFTKVRPRTLLVEKSGLAIFRNRPFQSFGGRLKHLNLRNNILKNPPDASVVGDVSKIITLDLSGNRLSSLGAESFKSLPELEELNLAENDIEFIEDGAFSSLSNLRVLSLQQNKLNLITNATFKGLSNLERLDLSNNEISSFDWGALADMKKLQVLNLGTNRITSVQLRGMNNLQKLLINNNSIQSLRKVSLRDLPLLSILSFDRNALTQLGENDLFGLATSTRLTTLSLASNNISRIHPRALSPLASLSALALQNNELRSLSTEGQSWLLPLKRLRSLFLSGNTINFLRQGELPFSVTVLALDHNNLQQVDAGALAGLQLTQLFLNNNHLHHLPKGTFDHLSNGTLRAIDISSNDWLCLCGEEWLGDWLTANKGNDVAEPRTNGCLASKACSIHNPHEDESHSTWVTAVAALLAAVSLVILIAIAWLFIDDGRTRALPPHKEHKARGVDVDRLRLINDRERTDTADAPLPPLFTPKKSGGRRVRFDGD